MFQLLLLALVGTAALGLAFADDTDDIEDTEDLTETPLETDETGTTIDAYGNILGTENADTFEIGSQSSALGLEGDDTITGVAEATISGGDGNDQIETWQNSIVHGDAGDDSLAAGAESQISGGEGDDQIYGSFGSLIDGGDGDDIIAGRLNDSTVIGGDGNDNIRNSFSGAIDDGAHMLGGNGDDTLISEGMDNLFGEDGDDVLLGMRSNILDGGAGNDTITGVMQTSAPVNIWGGEGSDEIYVNFRSISYETDSDTGQPTEVAVLHDFNPDEDVLTLALGTPGGNSIANIIDHTVEEDAEAGDSEVIVWLTDSTNTTDAEIVSLSIRLPGVTGISADQIRLVDATSDTELDLVTGTEDGDDIAVSGSSAIATLAGNDTVTAEGEVALIRLGEGDDSLTATSSQVVIQADEGDDTIVWTPSEQSARESAIRMGDGDDTLETSGDNANIQTGDGSDQIVLLRNAGPDMIVSLDGTDNEVTIGMGHEVNYADDGDAITVNVYPEHLDRDPAAITWTSGNLANIDIELNLPPEVTGPITVTQVYDDQYVATGQDHYDYIFATEDGTALLVVSGDAFEGFETDLVTINRDVAYA